MMIIDNKFDLGKIVYLKTDKDQIRRIVTAIQSSLSGAVLYRTNCGASEFWSSEMEICEEKVLNPEIVGS